MGFRLREVLLLLGVCGMFAMPGACGSVKSPVDGDPCSGACGPDQVCENGTCVDPCDAVECDEGFECIGGECVDLIVDADEDGFDSETDCDDGDPAVVPGSTRACNSDCGDGIEVCRDGEWQPCSAPQNCDCDEPREEPCERCGTAIRDCVDNVFAKTTGPCEGMGECEAGAGGVLVCGCEAGGAGDDCVACGTRGRECREDCTWGEAEVECHGAEIIDDVCPDATPFCNSNGICVPA